MVATRASLSSRLRQSAEHPKQSDDAIAGSEAGIISGCRVARRIESEGVGESEKFGSSLDVWRSAICHGSQVDLEGYSVSTRTEEVRMGEQSIEALVEI